MHRECVVLGVLDGCSHKILILCYKIGIFRYRVYKSFYTSNMSDDNVIEKKIGLS